MKEQREHLIGELFSVLEATGADTISQIQDGGLKSLAAMVRQLDKLEPQSKSYGAGTDRRNFWQLAGTPSAAGA